MNFPQAVPVFLLAFVCEFIDSTLGMGYGTTLTPVLLLMGFSPVQIVPAVLLSELVTGAMAAFMHHRAGNAFFDFRNTPEHRIVKKMGALGYIPRSPDARIAWVLGVSSIAGAVGAAFLAISIPAFHLKLFIGLIVTAMGVLILARRGSIPRFSWKRITGLGVVAAFNKGLSGGGYGPLVTSGQILSGVATKSAVAITSMAESFTCLVAVLAYLVTGVEIDWGAAPALTLGAVCSVPLSAIAVKHMKLRGFTLIVGATTLILGLFTLYKLL